MRYSKREVLTLQEALRAKQMQAEKDGWYAGKAGDTAAALQFGEQAIEYADLSERLFKVLIGMVEPSESA